jgi:hypothetical protein
MAHYAFQPQISHSDAALESALRSASSATQLIAWELSKVIAADVERRNLPNSQTVLERELCGIWVTNDPRLIATLVAICRRDGYPVELCDSAAQEGGEVAVSLAISMFLSYARSQRNQTWKSVAKIAGAGIIGGLLGGLFG